MVIARIPPYWLYAVALLTLLAVVRFYTVAGIGIAENEAYYWIWAQVPSLAYFDHTAGIGIIGWAWQQVFGADFLSYRALNNVLSLVSGLASFAAVLTLAPNRGQAGGVSQAGTSSWKTPSWKLMMVLLSISLLTIHAAHLVWLPDAVFLPFLSLAFWQMCRLLGPFYTQTPYQAPKRAWAWAGLFLGLAILAKETLILYAGLFCLLSLIHPRLRSDLWTSVWPWFGLSLIILSGLPTVLWNMENGWAFFTFQVDHAFIADVADDPALTERVTLNWSDMGSLFGLYLVVLGLPAVFSARFIARTFRQHWPLWLLILLPTLLYLYIAATIGIQSRWALASLHMGLILFLSLGIAGDKNRHGRGYELWGSLAIGICIVVLTSAILNIKSLGVKSSSVAPAFTWPVIFERLEDERQRQEQSAGEPVLLLANTYEVTSLINYSRTQSHDFDLVQSGLAEHRTLLPALNYKSRSNHYDFIWPELDLGGYIAILVERGQSLPPEGVFAEVWDEGVWTAEGRHYSYRIGRLIENPRPQLYKPPTL